MPALVNKTQQKTLAQSLERAQNLWQRIQGLLGRESMPQSHAFWLTSCPSVHTFFMKFPIDVIFTDKNFKVTSVFESVPAGRILHGGWKSQQAFEMLGGQLKNQAKKGDILYVGN